MRPTGGNTAVSGRLAGDALADAQQDDAPQARKPADAPPELRYESSGGTLRVFFRGDWKLGRLPRDISEPSSLPPRLYGKRAPQTRDCCEAACAVLAASSTSRLELCAENLGSWDSSLLAVAVRFVREARKRDVPVDDSGLPQGVRNLVGLALAVPPTDGRKKTGGQASFFEGVGDAVLRLPRAANDVFEFIGEVVLSFGRLLRGKSACTSANFWLCVQEASFEALPIVSLISMLVGLILAFVGVIQLSMFGAEIYISSLVAVGMTRIMGAIMTGIILAGRTGASYAAVIGTMQVNEEIDALSTLGVPPSDFLVMPRLLALTAMTPLLVLYADFMGIIGGFIVGAGILGLDPMEYLTFTQKGFRLANLWVGVAHGAVFGLVIAIIGCYQGLRCGRNAEAVGKATTSAVVFSIVGIVLTTAVLTILFNILKI